MEFESLKEENRNPTNFYRNRTQRVLEKWGIEGEMNQMNVRNAASSYARIQIKYRIMKWVTIGSVAFLAIFLGLMIGSVVLGIEATKELKVKDEMIVTGSKNTPLKTSEMTYSTKLSLTTPLSVVQGIKSLRYDSTKDGQKQYLEFQVVSFYYSQGRNLTLFGHTQMARVLADGSMEVVPLNTVNGAKRFDSSLAVRANDTTTQTTTPPLPTSTSIPISTCEQLRSISGTGKYVLTNDIDCGSTVYTPLPNFGGRLNGRMFTITMNVDGGNQVAGVFTKLLKGALITNVNFRGNVTGTRICGGLAARTESGVSLFTVNLYSRVVCKMNTTAGSTSSRVIVGGFFGYLGTYYSGKALLFYRCVTQGRIKVYTQYPTNTFIGGYFGLASSSSFKVVFKVITAASFFEDISTTSTSKRDEPTEQFNANLFGSVPSDPLTEEGESTTSKKTISIQDDLDWVCDYSVSEEGALWWEDFVWAYLDLTDGVTSGNEAANQALYEERVAICVDFMHYNQTITTRHVPYCCVNVGIEFDVRAQCMANWCNSNYMDRVCGLMYCFKLITKDATTTTIPTPEYYNGKIYYPDNYLPTLYYPQKNTP